MAVVSAAARAGAAAAAASSFRARYGVVFVWHAVFAFLAWGVLAPLGFALARLLRRAGRSGHQVHRAGMLGVLVLTGLTWVLGVVGARRDVPAAHAALGSLVTVLALLQGVAGGLRPPLDGGAVRAAWAAMHRALGGAALVAGAYTTHHSLSVFALSTPVSRAVDAVLAVAVACILAVELAPKRAVHWLIRPPHAFFADEQDDEHLQVKYAPELGGVPVDFREVQDDEDDGGDEEEEMLSMTPGR